MNTLSIYILVIGNYYGKASSKEILWAKHRALSGSVGTQGACQLREWAGELSRTAGSLCIQTVPVVDRRRPVF